MDATQGTAPQEAVNETYRYAASLLLDQKLSPAEATENLVSQGFFKESSELVVENLHSQIRV